MALYLESNVRRRLYLGFNWRNPPENSYFALSTNELQTAQIWFWSVDN